MKITFNAPFILTFTLIATLVLALSLSFGVRFNFLTLNGVFNAQSWQTYSGMLLYPLSHVNIQHMVGNFGIILLLGPILERKFGWKKLLGMCLITTLVIAIVHILISDSRLVGASGLVFMFIVLASLIDSTGKDIPLTFILVAVLFLGQEIIGSFRDDSISQMAHICGGIMGIVFRYSLK